MTLMKLRRKAATAQDTSCSVCEAPTAHRGTQLTDQLVVGQPGATTYVGEVCQACGQTLDRMVGKFGSDLTVLVEQAQTTAGDREITVARVTRDPTQARPPD
jgi:hypothetical protein